MSSIEAEPTGRVATNGVGTPFELSFWESVATSNDRAQLEAYLAQYPNGTFSGLAKAKIAAMPALAIAIPVAAPSPVPVPAAIAPASPTITPAAPPASPPSLLDQLAAVGRGPATHSATLFTYAGAVPPRPDIAPLTALAIPLHFCSSVERNAFHDTAYVPAVAQADRNNDATIAHIKTVQALHAQKLAANDVAGANALAHEATIFKPVADQAYAERMAMADLFARIMAVPITGC